MDEIRNQLSWKSKDNLGESGRFNKGPKGRRRI
jgi:hypothetical protein